MFFCLALIKELFVGHFHCATKRTFISAAQVRPQANPNRTDGGIFSMAAALARSAQTLCVNEK